MPGRGMDHGYTSYSREAPGIHYSKSEVDSYFITGDISVKGYMLAKGSAVQVLNQFESH